MSDHIPWGKTAPDAASPLLRQHLSLLRGLVDLHDQIEPWARGAVDAERARVVRMSDAVAKLLVSHGLRPTACVGKPVDLRFHEVVSVRPAIASESADQIVEIIQMGWELMGFGERVTVRRSKVIVAIDENETQHVQNSKEEKDD